MSTGEQVSLSPTSVSRYLEHMRIIFMGTPEYAVPSLRALVRLAPHHHVVGVITQPDRPKGRSRHPQPPPVKTSALELGLPADQILQPESVNEPATQDALRNLQPDLLCVVSFGALLRQSTLRIPPLALNAHGSLLPRFRGAAPIQAALLAGDTETGVTIQKMVRKMDAGPVLLKRATPIRPGETAGELHDRLADLSARCFSEAIQLLEHGPPTFEPQDESRVTYAPKLTKESGTIDWSRDAQFIERFVRAMSPWPGAWTHIAEADGSRRKRLCICSAATASGVTAPDNPGDARCVEDPGGKEAWLNVGCGSSTSVFVTTLKPEGGREMTISEWLRGAGRSYKNGARLD